ncbi:hypothetical protein [Dyella amyloliquefaciens]|uniref:hypothetical protein n=1 Tax=Dyella amyloliquefaciens TaxID=1770545 RepID=UPI00102E9610|nr:hypothetical protein [Dyella amyloliquefaciens]
MIKFTREKDIPVQKEKPAAKAMLTCAPPALATLLWNSYPRLVKLSDNKRAHQLLDEIAFEVTHGMLGNGDYPGGVRAALSIVAKGTWSPPRGFTSDWRGSVLRSL